MSSKKDYEATAAIFRDAVDEIGNGGDLIVESTVVYFAYRFAMHYAWDNPRFDQAKFMKACGLEMKDNVWRVKE